MAYFNSLNTLRALAVLLVIFQHWLPDKSPLTKLLTGTFGVDIFFTLSGFLITAILLRDIEKYKASLISRGRLIGNFFVRRILRIVPAYALALLLTFLLKEYHPRFDAGAWPYLCTFTFNIYIFRVYYWPGTVFHFWTLSVEEQYYLFWPLVLVVLPARARPYLMTALIILAVSVRIFLRYHDFIDVLTIACLDAFCLGGLLAWLFTVAPQRIRQVSLMLIGPVLILALADPFLNYIDWFRMVFFRRLIQSVISGVLIAYLVSQATNLKMPFRWFWENPLLVFIGKISYGMYLFHNLVPDIVPAPWYINNMVRLVVLVLFSWASWKFLELPILTAKKKFQ